MRLLQELHIHKLRITLKNNKDGDIAFFSYFQDSKATQFFFFVTEVKCLFVCQKLFTLN